MEFGSNHHLAYCTNIHRGSSWAETLESLDLYTMKVREQVCLDSRYAIGLRLSANAAKELAEPETLAAFKGWLEERNCYVFTINGFPYGDFHGTRVKEQVYRPDWATRERVEYTKQLFDILVEILPEGVEGSVSTVPGSFKGFGASEAELRKMWEHLRECAFYLEDLRTRMRRDLHLGLEPEPLCLFETSEETVAFFDGMLNAYPKDRDVLLRRIGVNYDCCHLAVEYESASEALGRLRDAGIRISKIHLSSALKVADFSEATLRALDGFCEPTYLHQVVARSADGKLERWEDLDAALARRQSGEDDSDEWRIHFHIPLHAAPQAPLDSTRDHILDTLDLLKVHSGLCRHFEMETYTWEVLPVEMGKTDVVDQLVAEYRWCLGEMEKRGLA